MIQMKKKKYKSKHIQNQKNIFEWWSLFHDLKHIVVGDISGQIILLELPKLFSEIVSDEKNIIKNIFDNKIKR